MRKKEKKPTVERARRRLRGTLRIKSFRLELIITIFCLMLLASGVTLVVYSILHALLPALENFDAVASSASILIACTIIGTGAAAVLSKWILAPLKEMIDATERIAKGDLRFTFKKTFQKHRISVDCSAPSTTWRLSWAELRCSEMILSTIFPMNLRPRSSLCAVLPIN